MSGSVDSVGEFFDLVTGYAFKSSDFSDEGIPVIKIKNVKAGHFSKHQFSYVSQDFLDTRSDKIALTDDLLISMSGNRHDGSPETWVGKVALFREADTYLINQRVGALRLKRPAGFDARFASFLLSSNPYQELFISIATSSGGQANLSPKQILGAPVRYPEIGEQRAIAHILGTLDDKIELNRRMNGTLEAMARALFKSWFVDFDPVRAKMEGRDPGLPQHLADLFPDRLVDSELGPIPEGWEWATFGDVVEQLRENENPLASPDSIFRHFSIPAFDAGQSPKAEFGQSIKSQKSHVPSGVVLLSKLNPEIERVWFVDVQPDERAVCSTEFLVLRPRPPYGQAYAYCLARSPVFRQELEGLVTGTSKSHQRAQAASILRLNVVKPADALATSFERAARPLLQRTLECCRESCTLAALRDTLLPKLISGELREAKQAIRGAI